MEAALVATSSGPTYFDHPMLLGLLLVASVITWMGIFRGCFWTFIAPSALLSVMLVVSWPIQWLYQAIAGSAPEGWHFDACLAVSFAMVVAGIIGLLALLGNDPPAEVAGGESR